MQYFEPDISTEYLIDLMESDKNFPELSIADAVYKFYLFNDKEGLRRFYRVFQAYLIKRSGESDASTYAYVYMYTNAFFADYLTLGIRNRSYISNRYYEFSRKENPRPCAVLEFFNDTIGHAPGIL